jgi:two-component system CheB/CheR fusion protein
MKREQSEDEIQSIQTRCLPEQLPKPKDAHARKGSFPVVAIGASAGGLEAYKEFFRALPSDTGMAFVLIQHLDPSHESMLTEIIAKITTMPVEEVRTGTLVRSNHIYVIPPNALMTLAGGVFRLSPRGKVAGQYLAVNFFMRSLAQERKSGAIAIVLSGTGADGTAGMEDVKAEGGITFVQDPATAKYDGMPRNVIDSGCADFILAPKDMAKELRRIQHHPYVPLEKPEEEESSAEKPDARSLVLSLKTWDWGTPSLLPPMQEISTRFLLNFASPAASISANINRTRFIAGHCATCCCSK